MTWNWFVYFLSETDVNMFVFLIFISLSCNLVMRNKDIYTLKKQNHSIISGDMLFLVEWRRTGSIGFQTWMYFTCRTFSTKGKFKSWILLNYISNDMLLIKLYIKWYVANKYLTIDLCFNYFLTYIYMHCRSSCGTLLVRAMVF